MDAIRRMYLLKFLSSFMLFGALAVPLLTQWAKLSYTELFLVEIWFGFWLLAFEIPTGAVADRIGRKKSLMWGGLIQAAGAVAYVCNPSLWAPLLGELLFGLGCSLDSGAGEAFMYDHLRRNRMEKDSKKYFGRMRIASRLGTMTALPLGSLMASMLPFPASLTLPTMLTAVPFLMAAVVARSLPEPKIRKSRESYFAFAKAGLRYLMGHRRLRILAVDRVTIRSTAFLMFWMYQALLMEYGVNLALFGFVAAGFNLASIVGLRYADGLERSLGFRKSMLATGLLVSAGYLVAASWESGWSVFIAACAVITAMNMRDPVFDDYMNRHIHAKNRATVLSAVSMGERILTSAIYLMAGILADMWLQGTIYVLAVLALAFAMLSWAREKKSGINGS